MSLLPQQILPPTVPLGRISQDQVIIDKNWWLFLYNIALQVLGTDGGLPASALIDLAALQGIIADSDAAALRQQLTSLAERIPTIPTLTAADIPAIGRATQYALTPPLPDAIPLAQPIAVIAVGASPFSYTALFAGHVAVTGGTVSAVAIVRQGTSIATGLTGGVFPVCRGDVLKVTYSGTPTMTFIPWSSQ